MTAPTPQTPPHQAAPLSARQAAAYLSVNEKTIRRWIDRGELPATKDASGAYRILPADLEHHRSGQAAPAPRQDAAPAADMFAPTMPQAAPDAAPRAAPVDLAPLVDHIASLEDRVQRLTEASTMWQIRAIQAEEKLKQLTAGADAPQPPTEPQEASPEGRSEEKPANRADDTSQSEPRSWWRRIFG